MTAPIRIAVELAKDRLGAAHVGARLVMARLTLTR